MSPDQKLPPFRFPNLTKNISAIVFIVATSIFFSSFAQAQDAKGKMMRDLMVGASKNIPLKAGQVVQVLKSSGQSVVIMAQEPDGSSGIFQVDAAAVQLMPSEPVPSASLATPTPATPVVTAGSPASVSLTTNAVPPAINNPLPLAAAPAAVPQPPSGLASELAGHLVSLQDGQIKDLDASTLQGVKYWAIYFSASWCPDCVPVTPQLARFYREFKADHPNFELILVCHDKTADAMASYMKTDDMPWPALRFTDAWNTHLWPLSHIARGIPNLILVDETGKVLSQTYQGDTPQDPMKVVDDIKTMVPEPATQL